MRNLFTQIKQSITFFFLMVLITFTGVASAANWVASGVRQVQAGTATAFLPVSEDNFATKELCDAWIASQTTLALSSTPVSNQTTEQVVDAACGLKR